MGSRGKSADFHFMMTQALTVLCGSTGANGKKREGNPLEMMW